MGGSAACCRSTSCWPPPPRRSSGARCAAGRYGRCRAQIALPAAAFFAFACCSLLWADDVEAGTNLLLFFTLPFVALLATVARADYPDWAPRWLAGVALAMGAIFAAVGLWQAATHELFFYAPNLAASNANTDYFRVTSLFGDPSLYGRHLVLGIGVALTLLATRRGRTWPLIGVVVLMWAGLLFSYSQSSMIALLVVTLALAVATGDARIRRGVALLTGPRSSPPARTSPCRWRTGSP